MPTPRKLTIGLLIATAVIMALMTIIAVLTPTRPIPLQSSTPNVTAIDRIISNESNHDDTGSELFENDEFGYKATAEIDQEPADIEESISRTNANLAENGYPTLSREEECLFRAAANDSDQSICRGI